MRSHCQTPTQTIQTTMGSIEIYRNVQTAQIPTQTQITTEPIVVAIGVGVGIWQCERTIRLRGYLREENVEFGLHAG